jgi:hypothetical protein
VHINEWSRNPKLVNGDHTQLLFERNYAIMKENSWSIYLDPRSYVMKRQYPCTNTLDWRPIEERQPAMLAQDQTCPKKGPG